MRFLREMLFFNLCLSLFGCFPSFLSGQDCYHKDLSRVYDFKTKISRVDLSEDPADSCVISVTVLNKTGHVIQSIEVKSGYLFKESFASCSEARSFTTGKGMKAKAVDNDYGDLVVADFNFDGREDIAIKTVFIGNGGPEYSYYVQDKKRHFVREKYLTEQVGYFPSRINKKDKTLTSLVRAGSSESYRITYRLDASNKWARVDKVPVSIIR